MENKNIDLFLENNTLLENLFSSKAHNLTIKFSALIATLNNIKIDSKVMYKNLDLIKLYTDSQSVFRNENALILATLMHFAEDAEKDIACTLSFYNHLERQFDSNSFLALASEILCTSSLEKSIDEIADNLTNIYSQVKKMHNFTTGKEDLSICALISASFKDTTSKLEEAEGYYKELQNIRFFPSSDLLLLSQALIFSKKNIENKALKVVQLHDFLEKENLVINGKALPILAFAIMACDNIKSLIYNIKETQSILRDNAKIMSYRVDDDIELAIGISLCISDLIDLKEQSLLNPLTVFILNLATRDLNALSEPFSNKIFDS